MRKEDADLLQRGWLIDAVLNRPELRDVTTVHGKVVKVGQRHLVIDVSQRVEVRLEDIDKVRHLLPAKETALEEIAPTSATYDTPGMLR